MRRYRFTADQAKDLAKKMVILVDSREKQNSHILDYFKRQKFDCQETKLDYGDYSFMIPESAAGEDIFFHRDIVVERKASLEELSGNLAQARERFEKEFLRAGNDGCKIYLMVEDPRGYTGIIGHAYKTQLRPVSYMASLKAFEARFGANVQFISPEYAGYYIISTFTYFCREALK